MKRLLPVIAIASLALLGCAREEPGAGTKAGKQLSGDPVAGKAFAERGCTACHGLDGRGTAPAIPHLAGQSERYLLAALTEYKEGKRTHAALQQVVAQMSEADARNVATYYAGLPPVRSEAAEEAKLVSPYERGKSLSASCAKCHGEDGNSATAGIPSLAGQQPGYLVVAIQEYLNKERKAAPMHALLPGLSKLDKESLALYFASQTPAERPAPPFGDPAAGEPLSAACGGCHGLQGVSADAATPSLAAQDARYLVDAIKAYRTTRQREIMRRYVTGLSEQDIQSIAAYYSVQKSRAAEKGQTIVQEITGKCERCHGAEVSGVEPVVPKIRGQDKDYLAIALRAYRDDRRESSVMHKMSLPYSDALIEALSAYYAGQPAK